MVKNSILSCLVFLGVSYIFRGFEFPLLLAMSTVVTLALGVIKKYYDLITKGTYDGLITNILGIILGIIIRIYV